MANAHVALYVLRGMVYFSCIFSDLLTFAHPVNTCWAHCRKARQIPAQPKPGDWIQKWPISLANAMAVAFIVTRYGLIDDDP